MNKPRLRSFEQAPNQRHIVTGDRYLYAPPPVTQNLVVIGCGSMGQEHMRVAALLGRMRVHGIYDHRQHSVDCAEENFRQYSSTVPVRYPDLRSACHDPAADVLLICTPNHTHMAILDVAMASGKPILLEKPMATDLVDAAKIVALDDAYASFIQIGLQYRFKAHYGEAIHEALTRRSLGAVKTIALSEYRPPFLDKVEQWNKYNRYTGGTLVEKCCHYFDLINRLAESTPLKVYASGGQAVNFVDFERAGEAADIDDHAFVVIDYANGIRANFSLNMFAHSFSEELVIAGDGGVLKAQERHDVHRQTAPEVTLDMEFGERAAARKTAINYPRAIEDSGHQGATYHQHIALADRLDRVPLDDGDTAAATPREGFLAMLVASAAQASMASGEALLIDDLLSHYGIQPTVYD